MRAQIISKQKRIFFALLTLAFMFIVTLIFAELMLRVAALFVGPRSLSFSGADTRKVVLSLGDSNTYGVFYSQEQAYPGQLQSILDRRVPGRYRVLNLGLPGMNSSQIAAQLQGWIEQFRPDTVIISAGLNNYWNRANTGVRQAYQSFFRGMRLYQLLRLAMTEATDVPKDTNRPEIKRMLLNGGTKGVEHLDAKTGKLLIRNVGNIMQWNLPHSEVSQQLYADLTTMAEVTEKNGVDLLVMTYAAFPLPERNPKPYEKQKHLNKTMRRFSKRYGVTLVDLRNLFLELLPPGRPRALFFANETESHPKPRGYREIATLVADVIYPNEEVVYSFINHLEEAVVEREHVPFEQVQRQRLRVQFDERIAIFQHPTSTIAFDDVPVGERASLDFAITIAPNAWFRPGDGVRFSIDIIDEGGGELFRTVFSLHRS